LLNVKCNYVRVYSNYNMSKSLNPGIYKITQKSDAFLKYFDRQLNLANLQFQSKIDNIESIYI